MNTTVSKKTSLFAIIAAAMMVFCAFAVAIPADRTNAADTDSTNDDESGIDIDFSRLDLQKMTGLYAVSSIETPLETYSYEPADAFVIGAEGAESRNVSDLAEMITEKKVLVIKNGSTVVFNKIDDKEYNTIEIANLVIENGAVFDATPLDSGSGDLGNLGIIKTANVAIDGVSIAHPDSLLIREKVTVTSLEKGEKEKLYVAFDVSSKDGGLTFSSTVTDSEQEKTYEWNLTIGGEYDRDQVAHAAEYRVSFDSTKTYADSMGGLTLSTLKGIVKQDAESIVADYDISLDIADLDGAVRTGNDPVPPEGAETGQTPSTADGEAPVEPAPDYSAKFGATGVKLTMKNTNGTDSETQKATHACDIHYQVNSYTYDDTDKEKDSAVSVSYTGLSMNLIANQDEIQEAFASFSTLRGYAKDEEDSNNLNAKTFKIEFKNVGIRGDYGFANVFAEIVKEGKITKENVGKIAENLVSFTMIFSADYFDYVSPAPVTDATAVAETDADDEETGGMDIKLDDASFTAVVDDKGILTFTSGSTDDRGQKLYLANTADVTVSKGAIVYKVHVDYLILNMENISVAKVLKYIVDGDISEAADKGLADLVSDVMTKQVLDGVKATLKCDMFTIGFTKTAESTTQNVTVQIGFKEGNLSTMVFNFTGTAMEIDANLTEITVSDKTTSTQKNGGSDLKMLKVAFAIGFEPQGIEEFGKLIKKSASSDFGFGDVLDYYRTVLSTDKAISWSSKAFTFKYLDYAIDYKGIDEDYYTDIHVSLSSPGGTSGETELFTMNHDKDKNELTAEFVNGSVLSYSSFVADGLEPVGNSSEIKNFKITGLNKTALDDGSKVVSFDIAELGASGPETEEIDSHAYFVSLKNAGIQLSVKDIRTIVDDEIALWKTAMAAEPEVYLTVEGFHGDITSQKDPETGVEYPTSFSYGHFDKNLCITYKLAGKEKVTMVPDKVSDKDQTVVVLTITESGDFIVDTEGQAHEGQSVSFILRAGVLEDVAEVPATCTVNGTLAHKHCTVDTCLKNYINGEEKTAEELVITAPGHTIVYDAAEPATKEKTGLTAGSHCSVCGTVLVAQEKIAKLPSDATKTILNTANDVVEIKKTYINNVIEDNLILEITNNDVSTDLTTKILTYLKDNYDGDFHLGIEKLIDNTKIENVKIKEALKNSNAIISLNLIMNNKEEHQLGSNATITMNYILPSDKKASDLYIVYADDDGNLTRINNTYENNIITFETDHFSYYAVMFDDNDDSDGLSVAAWIALASVVVLAIAILVMGQRSASKKN